MDLYQFTLKYMCCCMLLYLQATEDPHGKLVCTRQTNYKKKTRNKSSDLPVVSSPDTVNSQAVLTSIMGFWFFFSEENIFKKIDYFEIWAHQFAREHRLKKKVYPPVLHFTHLVHSILVRPPPLAKEGF